MAGSEFRVLVNVDGASFGNPGRAGIGIFIRGGGVELRFSAAVGEGTNNFAEYLALASALVLVFKNFGKNVDVEISADSELVVKQMLGEYKTKNRVMQNARALVSELAAIFHSVSIRHVPREQNKIADELSKKGARSEGQIPMWLSELIKIFRDLGEPGN